MNIKLKNSKVTKFLQGGAMAPAEDPEAQGSAPVEEGTPEGGTEQGGGEDPLMLLAQMAAQALQGQDCLAAMQVCQAFLQIVQQAQGGGAPEEQGQPVFKKGGILVRRIKK